MQKSAVNQTVESFLINHPEDIFDQANLSYKSGEIQVIINRFSMTKGMRDVHRWVMDVLNATANFRYASVPTGMFYELRHKNKSDEELKKLFQSLNKEIKTMKEKLSLSNLTDEDKIIITKTLNYCRHSIEERINSLTPQDRLLPLWQSSDLRNNLLLL